MKKTGVLLLLFLIILASGVLAANEISIKTDKLNFEVSSAHNVVLSNSGSQSAQVNFTLPGTWSFNSGSGCSLSGSTIICAVNPGSSTASFNVQSPGGAAEYSTTAFSVVATNNSYTAANSVTFLSINELFIDFSKVF